MSVQNLKSELELKQRIIEMIDGETPEVLKEIVTLLNYHTGYKAGVYSGDASFKEIIWNVTE